MSVINSGRFITIKGDKDEVNRLNSMQRAVDLKKESKGGTSQIDTCINHHCKPICMLKICILYQVIDP